MAGGQREPGQDPGRVLRAHHLPCGGRGVGEVKDSPPGPCGRPPFPAMIHRFRDGEEKVAECCHTQGIRRLCSTARDPIGVRFCEMCEACVCLYTCIVCTRVCRCGSRPRGQVTGEVWPRWCRV